MDFFYKRTISAGINIGAISGFIFFIIFGLVPGFFFGNYCTVLLIKTITGSPVKPDVLSKTILVAGTVLGLFLSLSICITMGSLVGMAFGYIIYYTRKNTLHQSEDENKKKNGGEL